MAGAYHRHGVCAYDALRGDLVWQRKDLAGGSVALGFDDRPLRVLSSETGEAVSTIRAQHAASGTRPTTSRSSSSVVETADPSAFTT